MKPMVSSEETNVSDLKQIFQRTRMGARTVRMGAGLCALLLAGQLLGADAKPDMTNVGDAKVAVKDISGVERRPFELADDKASVLFFVLHDCPIANAYYVGVRLVFFNVRDIGLHRGIGRFVIFPGQGIELIHDFEPLSPAGSFGQIFQTLSQRGRIKKSRLVCGIAPKKG